MAPAPKATLSSFLPISHSTESPTPRAQRFIVLATDGLYDQLENEEIVALVGAHLEGIRSVQSRKSLLSHISESTPNGVNVGHTHSPRQQPERGEPDPFIFEDGNLGTHLIRNALGGAKREQVSAMLSIPAPLSRRYRDDVSRLILKIDSES